ncbi:hypothetical protein Q9R19_05115 [Microbacterium sp. ARD32]|uniref:hypothetical protein n=1 Tax=Microbacterium sp. ARD32 TaxID=2962577 RepID=UPI002880C024|nr:hypothetical protein [Microbacterium sp. ARD32]MDT0157004.1 hypothetical protein [Microbacterium sp. ARD32]
MTQDDSTHGSGRARGSRRVPVPDSASDPTMVTNQPALRSSSGAVWLIASGVFVAVCLVPLIGIIATGSAATPVAVVAVVLLVALLVAEFVVRLMVDARAHRLRWLAACMLAMAVIALVSMMVCVSIVWSSVPR